MSVFERAERYVSKMDAAISGSRGHDVTFSVASVLVNGFSLGSDDALAILRDYNSRCQPPWSEAELAHKLRSAECFPSALGTGYLLNGEAPQSAPLRVSSAQRVEALVYEEEKLKSFAGALSAEVDAVWLANRSVVDPSMCAAADFLQALYRQDKGEKVLVFTNEFSQGDVLWPDEAEKLPDGGRYGVWFLTQPVSGEWLPNPRSTPPGKKSRRIAECVMDWRYLLLESDNAPARLWLGAVVQLPLRIAAIYTSGSRSVHVLVRVDCATKEAWDKEKAELLQGVVALGADRGALSGVRLSRLPSCWRRGKEVAGEYQLYSPAVFQKLLYLCPDPQPLPIVDMPVRRDVIGEIETSIKRELAFSLDGMTLSELSALQIKFTHFSRQSEKCRKAATCLESVIADRQEGRVS